LGKAKPEHRAGRRRRRMGRRERRTFFAWEFPLSSILMGPANFILMPGSDS